MPYSVLILTGNEAANIGRCIESLAGCDDVVVIDSFSTDNTAEQARAHGARVYQRSFDTFASQRNWGVDSCQLRHPWVLHLDADECMTAPLHAEIERVIAADAHSAYFIANKLMFMGRWIRHASMYPYYQARLLKRGEADFRQVGHGQILGRADRGTGTLHEPYVHHNFSRGVSDWVERHNRYSNAEAERLVTTGSSSTAVSDAGVQGRQQLLKRQAARLPFRPFIRFVYLYMIRGGFLDGREGFDYCILMSFYDYLTRLKARELQMTGSSATKP
jgi:glycosyltransferase involved in cell wall biosynthesis